MLALANINVVDSYSDANRQLAALNEASQRILQVRDEAQLCALVPRLLSETLDFRVAILNLEEEGRLLMAGFHVLDATPGANERFLDGVRNEDHAPPADIRRCFESAKTIVSNSESWAPGCGRSRRTISRVPSGHVDRSTKSVSSTTSAPSRRAPPASMAGCQQPVGTIMTPSRTR